MSRQRRPGLVRAAYAFIKAHQNQFPVQVMCRILEVASSGYYDWCQHPLSNRAQEDARLVRLIRASFTASHGIYGAPRVFLDLREAGEACTKHCVARLMPEYAVGKPSVLIPNLLQRRFTVTRPNPACEEPMKIRPLDLSEGLRLPTASVINMRTVNPH